MADGSHLIPNDDAKAGLLYALKTMLGKYEREGFLPQAAYHILSSATALYAEHAGAAEAALVAAEAASEARRRERRPRSDG